MIEERLRPIGLPASETPSRVRQAKKKHQKQHNAHPLSEERRGAARKSSGSAHPVQHCAFGARGHQGRRSHTHTHTRTRGITQVSRRSDRETKAAIRAYTTEKRVAGLWLVTHWVSHGEGGGMEGGGGVGDRFASSFGALSDCVKRKLTRSSSSVFRLCCSVRAA